MEETARLAMLSPGVTPLDEARIDELRRQFGAHW